MTVGGVTTDRPKFRFSIRSMLAITALVASCLALLMRSNGELVALWLTWAYLWAIGIPSASQWRFVWWSWAAVLTLPSAMLFQIASGYQTIVPVFGRLPRIGETGHYFVETFVWISVVFGLWCCNKSWATPRNIAKISSVLSAAMMTLGASIYLWLLVR